MPPFIIDCYDEDQTLVGKNDCDFLARATIYNWECNFSEGDSIPEPKWHPLRFSAKGPVSGEILVSFAIVEDDFTFQRQLEYVKLHENVDMREFQVSMNILGMRGLQSTGLLPVTKAFVNFNLKGLVPPTIGTNLKNLKTDPKAPGSDPTINTMMKFFVPLPIDPLYCPRLSCQVYDCIFAGFSQPILGNFTIPIGDLIHELAAERKVELEALELLVTTLDKIAAGEERASILAQSMRGMVADQMAVGGASQSALDSVRSMNSSQKAKIVSEFASMTRSGGNNGIEEEISVNPSMGVDTGALLTGDADEELRMADRLAEKSSNAKEGKMPRVTVADIRPSQRGSDEEEKQGLLLLPQNEQKERTGSSGSGSGRKTPKLNGASPNYQKFDAKLKKQLITAEKDRKEKANRDANDERCREMEVFKAAGNKASANTIMPIYERDTILECDREVNKPPESQFIALGWDEDSTTKRKHYRRFYPDELENVREVLAITSPFQTYEIKRGQSRGAKAGLFASLFGEVKEDESG